MKTTNALPPHLLRAMPLCAALLLLVTGCQTAPKLAEPTPLAYPPKDLSPLNHITCLDGENFRPLDAQNLIQRASQADIILIGELHGNAQGLAASTALWQGILGVKPNAVLALEFLERDQQILVDDWLDLETLVDPEGFSFKHGPMMLSAKEHGRPVIAANAPRRYVRLARTRGYEHLQGMTPAQRATFVVPDSLPSGGYRDRFFDLFKDEFHGTALTTPAVESYWRAQAVWDATMADSVVHALNDANKPVVLVVGRFHVKQNGGTLQMLKAYRPDTKIFSVIMAFPEEIAEAKTDTDSPKHADALWVLDPPPSKKP